MLGRYALSILATSHLFAFSPFLFLLFPLLHLLSQRFGRGMPACRPRLIVDGRIALLSLLAPRHASHLCNCRRRRIAAVAKLLLGQAATATVRGHALIPSADDARQLQTRRWLLHLAAVHRIAGHTFSRRRQQQSSVICCKQRVSLGTVQHRVRHLRLQHAMCPGNHTRSQSTVQLLLLA